MSTFYKIQSAETGLFSTGGEDPKWSKVGKIWEARGHLTSHFTGLTSRGRQEYAIHGAKVVECEFTVLSEVPVADYVAAAQERKQARVQAAKTAREERQRQSDMADLQRLAKKLGVSVNA